MKGALLMTAASLVLSQFVSQIASAGEFVVTKLEDSKAQEVYDVLDKNLEKSDKPGYDVDEIVFAKKNKITGVQDDLANVIYKKKIGAAFTIKEKKLSAYDSEKLKALLAIYSKKEENRLAKVYKLEGLKCQKGAKTDCSVIEK